MKIQFVDLKEDMIELERGVRVVVGGELAEELMTN